jgi:hypothetical protein
MTVTLDTRLITHHVKRKYRDRDKCINGEIGRFSY